MIHYSIENLYMLLKLGDECFYLNLKNMIQKVIFENALVVTAMHLGFPWFSWSFG